MPKITLAIFILIASAGWSAAAGDSMPQREKGDLAIRSRAILNKYCGACHKEGSVRSSMSVLDHKQLVGNRIPPPFVSKTGARSQVLEFLDDGSMPPAGHLRPSDDEINVLKQWVAAKRRQLEPFDEDDDGSRLRCRFLCRDSSRGLQCR